MICDLVSFICRTTEVGASVTCPSIAATTNLGTKGLKRFVLRYCRTQSSLFCVLLHNFVNLKMSIDNLLFSEFIMRYPIPLYLCKKLYVTKLFFALIDGHFYKAIGSFRSLIKCRKPFHSSPFSSLAALRRSRKAPSAMLSFRAISTNWHLFAFSSSSSLSCR